MPRTAHLESPRRHKGGSSGIGEILRQRLVTGYWKPNDRLPTEKELAQELKACPATIQRHLKDLQKEGLIWGRRGKGRFVSGVGQRPRTGNIGVVLFDSRHLANPTMSGMVAGVGKAAVDARQSLRIFIGNELRPRQENQEMALGSVPPDAGFLGAPAYMGVDGLLVLTQRLSPETIAHLAGTVPVVCSFLLPMPNVSCLVMDTASGAFDAMRHLLDLGHRRIGLITKDMSDAYGRATREGARMAMGTVPEVRDGLRMYTATEFDPAEGYRLGKELLAEVARPTAVICGDHELTKGVLQAIDEAGLRVPADVSVICGNEVLADRTPVSITSIWLDPFNSGVRLCQRLLERVEQPEHRFEDEYIRPRLVIRQSTAPPPAKAD